MDLVMYGPAVWFGINQQKLELLVTWGESGAPYGRNPLAFNLQIPPVAMTFQTARPVFIISVACVRTSTRSSWGPSPPYSHQRDL